MNQYNLVVRDSQGAFLSGTLHFLAPDNSPIQGAVMEYASPFMFSHAGGSIQVKLDSPGYQSQTVTLTPGENSITLADGPGVTVSACRQYFSRNSKGECVFDWPHMILVVVLLLAFFFILKSFL